LEVADICIETGLPPQVILALDARFYDAILQRLHERAEEAKSQARKGDLRERLRSKIRRR